MEEDPVPIILSIFSQFELHLYSVEVLLSFILIVILVFCSAFISGAEVAYFSLTQSDLESLEKKKGKQKIMQLLSKPNYLLATILIANNFVNIAIIVVSTYCASHAITFAEDSPLEFIFQVMIITSLLVLFGEITPKVYANKNALRFSKWMAAPLMFMNKLFYPLSLLLVTSTRIIDKRLKQKNTEVSMEEISKALDLTETESKEQERKILRSIVEFGNTDVKEIMKSRLDVVAIEEQTAYKDVLHLIISSGYSRIPVYREQFDNVLGILYIKDLIPHLDAATFDWIILCRAPYFVPETKMINDLLKEFQAKKNHIAIVVDEYGGASGIVTLEDVIEEIVGEINDEFDDDERVYSKLDEQTYIFEGKILLNDFLKIVKGKSDCFDQIKGESDALAGLILEHEGRIPEIGSIIEIPPYTFKVESTDMRRIKRLKVSINES